jgi:anti-sigma-K factor RskA
MSCSELQEDLDLYSLGLLDRAGCARVREHLDSGCRPCRKDLLELWAANAIVLRSLAPGNEVPRQLRRESMGFALTAQPSYRWVPLAACAALVLSIVAGWEALHLRTEALALRREAALLRNASLLVSSANVRQAAFGGSGKANGRAFVDGTHGAALFATGLAPLPAGATYEMWLVPKSGSPRPAGLFLPDASGAATAVYLKDLDPASIAAIAVSREPAGGSPQPTSQPLIVAPL